MNNIEKYIEEINKYKNDMLENYKNSIVNYEESRQLYEKIIDKFEDTSTILPCSQIVAYNNSVYISSWVVELLDGTKVYESGNYSEWKTCVIDLSKLELDPKTQLKLKIVEAGDNPLISTEILQYTPSYSTVYYEANANSLYYRCMIVSPFSPPVLKCTSLSAKNDANVHTKYELRMADGSGTIYNSGKYTKGDTWSKNLNDLNIPPNTQLILHAGVISGDDSEPYLIIEYDPTLSTNAHTGTFKLVGNAFLTQLYFEGMN